MVSVHFNYLMMDAKILLDIKTSAQEITPGSLGEL